MVDKVEDTDNKNPAENFNEGFLEGISDSDVTDVDPLDFADKPESAPVVKAVVEDEQEDVDAEGEEDAPAPVAEKEEKPKPVKDHTAEIVEMLDKRLPKESPLQPAPAAVEQKKEPEPVKPALTDEETNRLKELSGEWKDVNEMVALQMKTVADTVAKEVARQVADIKKDFESRLQPVQQSVELSAAERYDRAVKEFHPEVYDKTQSKAFGDELVQWVNKQPNYLQQAYLQAFDSQDPQDAIDLITRFKSETGKDKQEHGESQTETSESSTEKVSDEDKSKRLRLMKKPTSRQTKGAESDDPLDFEGGFKEMVREQQRAK